MFCPDRQCELWVGGVSSLRFFQLLRVDGWLIAITIYSLRGCNGCIRIWVCHRTECYILVEGSSGLSVAPGVSRRFWKHGSLICLRVCVTILCKKNKYSVFCCQNIMAATYLVLICLLLSGWVVLSCCMSWQFHLMILHHWSVSFLWMWSVF